MQSQIPRRQGPAGPEHCAVVIPVSLRKPPAGQCSAVTGLEPRTAPGPCGPAPPAGRPARHGADIPRTRTPPADGRRLTGDGRRTGDSRGQSGRQAWGAAARGNVSSRRDTEQGCCDSDMRRKIIFVTDGLDTSERRGLLQSEVASHS